MPKSVPDCHRLVIDIGNHAIKYSADNGQVQSIRSVYCDVAEGQNSQRFSHGSPIIQNQAGKRHFGSQALLYPSHQKLVTGKKEEFAGAVFCAANAVSGDFSVVVSHHSPESDAVQSALNGMVGEYCYRRNGQEVEARVCEVEIVPEGYGTYLQARKDGLVPDSGFTIVIDIGGGSWLYSVYDADGNQIEHMPVDKGGVYHLAMQVAYDARLRKGLQQYGLTSPDIGAVMDGFQLGHYYQETGITWGEWLPEYLKPWFQNIFGTVQTNEGAAGRLPRVKRVLVTGGGANLISGMVKDINLFAVVNDPQTASVRGLNLLHQPHLKAVA